MTDRIYVPAGEDIVEIDRDIAYFRRNLLTCLGIPAHLLEHVPFDLNRHLIEQQVAKVNKLITEMDNAIKNW